MKEIQNDYLITILDRLTRFKPACIRYKRVFIDIINKFSNEKINANLLNDDEIIALAEKIFKQFFGGFEDNYINEILLKLEDKYFVDNLISKKYLSSKINYTNMLNKLDCIDERFKNVIWLSEINKDRTDLNNLRYEKKLLYPIEKLILVEGQTEFILLNTILKLFNFDLDKLGILVYSTDGKNRSARKYYELIEYLKIPIFVLLDKDAAQIKNLITPKLRKKDSIYLLNSGEFEDLIPTKILTKAINSYHKNEFQVLESDFIKENTTVENLEIIYRKYGFGDFKKARFAQILKNYIEKKSNKDDFETSEIKEIITHLQ